MTTKRKVFAVILFVLTFLTLAFIWGNSVLSMESSASESQGVYEYFKGILDFIFGKDVITHNIFRKFAHAGEFFVLATEINLIFITLCKAEYKYIVFSFLIAVACAGIDETIQIFSSRGSSVTDVLIDSCGNIFSCIIFVIITLIIKKKSDAK